MFPRPGFLQAIARFLAVAILTGATMNAAEPPPARPFPQHTPYAAGAIKPNHVPQARLDEATRNFYESWKKAYLLPATKRGQFFVLNDEGKHKDESGTTSEGHGYGMLITAFLAGADGQAHEIFDGLFRYFREHPSSNNPRLMAWEQAGGGANTRGGGDSATDGDLDIAQALLLAHAQWGSAGAVDYLAEARALIAAIKKDEINRDCWSVKLGDWATPDDDKFHSTRPSDFMADHFRAFATATGDGDWMKVTDTCYRVIGAMQADFSPATGLIPDFVVNVDRSPAPAPGKHLEGKHDGHFYYNSCRVPLRLGIDFLLHGEPRAKSALEKMNSWIKADTDARPDKL
ncbi:MAG: glycosyl hydrolase family 8, partial [Chthoniobacteraceae bacterium]